jgi:hypothetical protein
MTGPDIGVWILRGFGALWIFGALFGLRQLWFGSKIDQAIEKLEQMAREFGETPPPREPEDKGREAWMIAGLVLLFAAGVAMVLAHRLAVPLLATLIIQQLGYFIRQRRRELRAKTPEEAAEARPERTTVNGFITSLLMATLAAWLFYEDRLL